MVIFQSVLLIAAMATVLWTVVYLYLRKEQAKIITKDKYESAIKGSDSPKLSLDLIKAGFIGLIICTGLFLLWVPAAAIVAMASDSTSDWPEAAWHFIRFLFLASMFLLAGGVLRILLSTYNKIIVIFCIILVAGVSSYSYYLNRGGCLWWECAPTRSFDVADLGLPSNFFPANIDAGKFFSRDDGNPETYQNGEQQFTSVSDSGLVGFYRVEMYSSNKKAAQRFISSQRLYDNLNNHPTKPKDINYISPLADQFYISCEYGKVPNCVAMAQYQEFFLYLYVSTYKNGMTTQGFQQVVIYMDRQISKYLYEK